MADVELLDGRHLDHTVIRLGPVAVATVVNEANEVLLLWRHRFITDAWGWELPSGGTGEGETLVSVELVSGEVTITMPSDIALYVKVFNEMPSMAVYGAEARTLIAQAIRALR